VAETIAMFDTHPHGLKRIEDIKQGLAEVREKLGPPGAVARAADAIAALLKEHSA